MTAVTVVMDFRVITVGKGNGRIDVTDQAGGITGHITEGHMVDIAVNSGVRCVAIKTVDRCGAVTVRDDAHHLRPGTVMAGGAGTGTVGGNVMLDPFDFRPVGDHVTTVTGDAGGEVAGPDLDRVVEVAVIGTFIGMATQAADLAATNPLCDLQPYQAGINRRPAIVVADTAGYGRGYPMQCIHISITDQGAGARLPQH